MPSVAKELMLKELRSALEAKNYIFFTRFQNISVADLGELRRKLEKVSDRSLVPKNSLAKKIFKEFGIEAEQLLQGNVLVTVGQKEPQVISKVLVEFAKDREHIQLLGASIERKIFDSKGMKALASLPSRQVLLTQVVVGLNSPIQGFATVLNQLVQGLVITLSQIQKQKAGA